MIKFGSNKQSSKSQSTSNANSQSSSYQDAVSNSLSDSQSTSVSSGSSFVDQSQQPYLDDIRSTAQSLSANGMPVEGVAQMTSDMANINANQYAGGNMQAGAGAGLMSQGSAQMAGTGQAMNYATGAMGGTAQGGIDTAMGAGQSMAGNAAMANSAMNQGFNPNNASRYINNDVLSGQIDAASRDITRNLNENTLTGISSGAAGTGNSGSTRAGIAAGIAMRGAGDRIGDIAASMRGNAYNQGLNIEAQRAAQNAGFQQQTNMGNQNAYNNMMQYGAGVGQNAYNNNMQNQQFGATMAQNIGQSGVSNMVSGQNMMNTGFDNSRTSAQYGQDYNQSLMNYDYRSQMSPYSGLDFYSGIVGAPTILQQNTSASDSTSRSLSDSSSQAGSESSSTAQSESFGSKKGSGFNFGIGDN